MYPGLRGFISPIYCRRFSVQVRLGRKMKKTSGTRVLMGHLLFYAVYFVALSSLDGPMPVVIMYAFSLTLIPTLHFLIKDMPCLLSL